MIFSLINYKKSKFTNKLYEKNNLLQIKCIFVKKIKMDKKEYIRRLANFLHDNGTTMAANELAEHLNRNKFTTNYGTEYTGGRGTYTLIHVTYDWLVSIGKQNEADNVANAFPKPDGEYAFD